MHSPAKEGIGPPSSERTSDILFVLSRPAASLDPESLRSALAAFEDEAQETTVVLTHDESEAIRARAFAREDGDPPPPESDVTLPLLRRIRVVPRPATAR
jgi:hypothetical protein